VGKHILYWSVVGFSGLGRVGGGQKDLLHAMVPAPRNRAFDCLAGGRARSPLKLRLAFLLGNSGLGGIKPLADSEFASVVGVGRRLESYPAFRCEARWREAGRARLGEDVDGGG
jgi:hypothetical protein